MNGYQKRGNSGTDVMVHNASNLSSGIELVSFEILKMSFQIEKIRLHWMDASFHCSYSICKFLQSAADYQLDSSSCMLKTAAVDYLLR